MAKLLFNFALPIVQLCVCFCHLCSGSHLRVESSSESGGRRDTGASLDSVGASSGSLSPLEPPSPLFPPDGSGGEGSLTSEVFLSVLKLNQNRKRQETRYGTHLLVLSVLRSVMTQYTIVLANKNNHESKVISFATEIQRH